MCHNRKGWKLGKVAINVESLEGVERQRTYVEVLSKVVANTVVTNSKPKNTNKNKTMNWMFLRPILVCVGAQKIEDT